MLNIPTQRHKLNLAFPILCLNKNLISHFLMDILEALIRSLEVTFVSVTKTTSVIFPLQIVKNTQ